MANKDRKVGFAPQGEPLRETKYVAGGTVYPGDLVKTDNTGRVVVCAAGDASIGACATYGVAGDNILVWDHPDQRLVCQASGGAEITARTDTLLNYNHTAGTASTTFKVSRQTLDSNSGGTSSVLTLKLLDIADEVGDGFGSNAKVVCKINNHQLQGGTGTVGT